MYTIGMSAPNKFGILIYFIEGDVVDVGDNDDERGGKVAAV